MRPTHLVLGTAVLLASGGPAAAAPRPGPERPPLTLRLQPSPLAVKFVNTGKEPVRILKPIDGSEWGWVMPHYKLTVIDDHDREIDLAPRCKLYGSPYSGTRWPDDYVVTIRPGESYTHPLTHNHNVREAGRYRVRFEYRFTPKADGIVGGPYPAGLWRGTATSDTVEVELKPRG